MRKQKHRELLRSISVWKLKIVFAENYVTAIRTSICTSTRNFHLIQSHFSKVNTASLSRSKRQSWAIFIIYISPSFLVFRTAFYKYGSTFCDVKSHYIKVKRVASSELIFILPENNFQDRRGRNLKSKSIDFTRVTSSSWNESKIYT